MQGRMLRLALLGAALGKAAASATTGAEAAAEAAVMPSDAALVEDDACEAADGECSLALRQLRASGSNLKAAEPEVEDAPAGKHTAGNDGAAVAEDSKDDDAQEDMDDDDGIHENEGSLPGGWGEAAEMVREDTHNAAPDNGTTLSMDAGWGGTCARQGCHHHYIWGQPCQCNPGCVKYRNCCWDYGRKCTTWYQRRRRRGPAAAPKHSGNIKTLYHATSAYAGPLILKNGFRLGTQGWCGGGIYFAESVEATKTKAIGPDSHQGFLIQAVVDVGRTKYMGAECDRQMTAQQVTSQSYSSVSFDPGDGREWVVYNPNRVLSTKPYR